MGQMMSMDDEKSKTDDDPIRLSVDDIEDALDDHLLINLVASEDQRHQILELFTHRCGDTIEIQRIDGLMHDYGDLVDVLRQFSRPHASEETKLCILVDHWSEELIGTGDDELFSRWFNELSGETHTLVLGTETPLASSASDRLRKLIPPNKLANMHISRPTVTSLSRRAVAGGAAGLGITALLTGVGPLPALAAIPAGIAAAYPALRDTLGNSGDKKEVESEAHEPEKPPEDEPADESAQDSWVKRMMSIGERVLNLSDDGNEQLLSDDEEQELRNWLDSEELQQVLPETLTPADLNKLEQLREMMEPQQLRDFVAASAVDVDSDEDGHLLELVHVAAEATRWADFLRYLNGFDDRIRAEAGEMGFCLQEDQGQHFATYLTKVGYEPEKFAASLFRTSDLVNLFPYFDPAQWEPQQFLKQQFKCWDRQKSVMINDADTNSRDGDADSYTEDARPEVAPSTMEHSPEAGFGRPVRRLFQVLKELNGEEALETNLKSLEDYKELTGPLEPRFCEWAYKRIERRELINGLTGEILRSSDVKSLRNLMNLSAGDSSSWPQSLRDVLAEVGVQEAELPPHLDSGIGHIRRATKYFSDKTSPNIEMEAYDDQGSVTAARKGIERLLKLYVTFLWKGGLSKPITQVIVEGRQGFDPTALDAADLVTAPGESADTSEWSSQDWKKRVHGSHTLEDIQGATAGVLNHLLQALARDCAEREIEPPFLRHTGDAQRLWPDPVFQRIRSLITTLNKLSHDNMLVSEEERSQLKDGLEKKLQKVVSAVDEGRLRIPQPIQFFRRHDDGHGIHYEGYTDTNDHLWFYEVEEEYKLGSPYLFLAATNPSAVDMTCVPFPTAFQR